MSDHLSAQDFYRFLQCPHWPYWERFGDPKDRRPLTEAEEERNADGLEHERRIVEQQFGSMEAVEVSSSEEGFASTLALMKKGVPLIYQAWLMDGDWVGRPDVLERHEGESRLGSWYYAPVDIKRAHEVRKEHKAQLTFYALLLERIQGVFPRDTAIVNGDGDRLPVEADAFVAEFQDLLKKIQRIRAGERPEPVYRKACVDTSPWGEACFRLAKETNDIALIFNVDVKKLQSLRSCGVLTVEDAAELNPETLEGCAPHLTLKGLESVKRQARSLRDNTVIVRKSFEDPTLGMEIHFDIESHPPTDRDYLYGFWLRDAAGERPQSFLAERPEDEEAMWRAFMDWLPTLPADYTVYHYAAYEPSRLTILSRRYGDEASPWLARFRSRLVDLKEKAREHAVFPLYFYSLKKICTFLGFAWEGEVKGGGESVVAYDKWLREGDRRVLNAICQYNQEDVRATAFLLDWLRAYAKGVTEYAKPYPWERKT